MRLLVEPDRGIRPFPDVRRSVEDVPRPSPGRGAGAGDRVQAGGGGDRSPRLARFDEPELAPFCSIASGGIRRRRWSTSISDETRATAAEMSEAIADQRSGQRGWQPYPHILLRDEQYLWTSVHVALVKASQTAAELARRPPGTPSGPGRGEDEEARIAAVAWGRRKIAAASPRSSPTERLEVSPHHHPDAARIRPAPSRRAVWAFEASATSSSMSAGRARSGSIRT